MFKEFWIFKGTSNFCNELDYDCRKRKPEGFYDIVSTKDTIEGGVHVVEMSALESANAEILKLNELILKYDSGLFIDFAVEAKKWRVAMGIKSEQEKLTDQLESANAEIKQLKMQLDTTNSNWPHEKKLHEQLESANAEIAALNAKLNERDQVRLWNENELLKVENAKLRAALEEIRDKKASLEININE